MSQEPASSLETVPQTALEPHRGGKILALGIVSVLTLGLIFLFTIIASDRNWGISFWVFIPPLLFAFATGAMARAMGMSDQEKMDEGKMAESGWWAAETGRVFGFFGALISGSCLIVIIGIMAIEFFVGPVGH